MPPQDIQRPEDAIPAALGVPFAMLGGALMAVALVILFYLCGTVYDIMNDPGQVKLVQFLMEKVNDSDKGIYGQMDHKDFDIHLGEPLRYIMYFFTGALVLGVIARIFNGLIVSGAQLLRMGVTLSAKGRKSAPADIIGPPPV